MSKKESSVAGDIASAILVVIGCLIIVTLKGFVDITKPSQQKEAITVETSEDTFADEYFVLEKELKDNNGKKRYKIVHTKDTGVKYIMSYIGNGYSIAPLYNTDGTLQIADGYK